MCLLVYLPIWTGMCVFSIRTVMFRNINKNYLSISPTGLISVWEGEQEFVTLERWEQEYHYHCRLLHIPTFALFKKWKTFRVWRANVCFKKIHKHREFLQKNLFIVNEVCRGLRSGFYHKISINSLEDGLH